MKYLLFTLILLLNVACAQHQLTPEDRCNLNATQNSAEWWLCVHNEDMLDKQFSLAQEIKEAHADRFKKPY